MPLTVNNERFVTVKGSSSHRCLWDIRLSTDEKELNLDMIKGKVIVIFYETKDIVENNKRIKDGSPKSPCHLREPPDISFENRPILDSNPSRRRHTLEASSVLDDVCSSYSVVLVWGESLLKTG